MDKNIVAAKRAASILSNSFNMLQSNPKMGRPFSNESDLREVIIEFGVTGYVALYKYNEKDDTVYILAFRHQKEAGY